MKLLNVFQGSALVFPVLLLSFPRALAGEAETPVYVKKDTWVETMLASRAGYLRWKEQQESQEGRHLKPFVSKPIRGDGPGQKISVSVAGARFLRLVSILERGGGNCHIWGGARLIARDGTETRLSGLQPVRASVGWGKLIADRNWQDQPLRIGNRKFEHGIWVHANSDVSYRLDGKYERFEAWAGMDAARANGVARFKVLFNDLDLLPVIWKKISVDFPLQAKWFADDTRRRHQEWFGNATSTRLEREAIRRALGQLRSRGDALRLQLGELRPGRAGAGDPRWLNLYARACRARQCCEQIDGIWIVQLRQLLEGEIEGLLGQEVSPDDPRWNHLTSRMEQIARKLRPGQLIDTTTIRPSIQCLAGHLAGRFTGGTRWLEDLKGREESWRETLGGAARGEKTALDRLPAVAGEIRDLRRGLILELRGMREFLATPAHGNLIAEWENQFEAIRYDLRNRGHFGRVAPEALRREALILEEDRDPADVVLRRTAALLAHLKGEAAVSGLDRLEEELKELLAARAAIPLENSEARYVLFADACRIRRQIAWRNPLLSFDKILFIKRHRALFNHMCDQYYGMAATPGGGLYVISGAFGPNPEVLDVLAHATVKDGRLKGQKLSGGATTPPRWRFDGVGNLHGPDHQGGSFLSPALSYDGQKIVFAYVECRGDPRHRHHADPTRGHWTEGRCYHIFKVNTDGTELEQLTDGTWNDFDPCWLPNGRLAFISERRGGYLRCGRVCPTYTLFDMAADGSEMTCLSFHETNEWHPSVTNDGRIIWTRWDYVDRHGCTAHMPWTTSLGGRDPRPVHGNYAPRRSRPDMEVHCRAIPGSHGFVATAAPHHGQAYGSLVLIDPHIPDNDGMGPVRRITPEIGFPESQGGSQVYGTPWPLSEDFYLCVYDASMQPGVGFQGGQFLPGNYGIYLVDSFGNRELIYRDPEIACLSPIPLRPRPRPSVVPELVKRGPETNPAERPARAGACRQPEGTVAVINVYKSLKPWPEGTRIKELRVLQVIPMSVPSGGPPHETGLRVASAGDSVVPTRNVLGTVPVEEDGSAHFTVPANREIFFQALDENGMAIQSMRSATHLQEGEHLVCAGCHEAKQRAPDSPEGIPLALRRAPSRLKPDVDGSNPFSYPRLVQPVLDRQCVPCHSKNRDRAPNLGREPIERNWYASYNSLVRQYGFHNYGDGYRTTPGRFGARASKLYELLKKGHYDVQLSSEERHRLTLWLDCSSLFYGVYEREGGKAQLRGEIVRPTLE